MEFPKHSEIDPKTRAKIILPTEFDRRIVEEPKFTDTVAGFTTLSAGLFKQGIMPDSYYVMPWGNESFDRTKKYINLDLTIDVAKSLAKGSHRSFDSSSTLDTLRENRGHQFGVQVDLYRDITGQTEDEYFEEFILNGYTTNILEWIADENITDPYYLQSNLPDILGCDEEIGEGEIIGSTEAIYRRFSAEGFMQYLNGLRVRQGIQIVYGDKATLVDFIEKQEYVPVDDNGVTIYDPIPDSIIIAILPLGDYEQNLMLSL